MKPAARALIAAGLATAAATSAFGEVKRFEVLSREAVSDGAAFGEAGPYERITGRVVFSVAPGHPRNRRIVDLDKAVNLEDGRVEFSADVVLLRPRDPGKGNGTLLLEVPNRGKARIVGMVDGGDWKAAQDAGDGWLLRRGYSWAALGWQWDATGDHPLALQAPIAKDGDQSITGLLRGDVILPKAMDDLPLGHLTVDDLGGTEYPVASSEDPRNTLSVRDTPEGERQLIPRERWRFARTVDGHLVPSDRHLHLDGGFQPGRIYEYVYVVKDPVVAGLGFAAVRDFASYVKHAQGAVVPARRVIAEGISQNGRFLRDLVYQGFNADEQGRTALDGILAHVAGAGRGSFNQRFAQPSRDAQPTSSLFFPTDLFPFTDLPETDPLTGEPGGLLDRAAADKVLPKLFLSNTSYEYWGRVASLTTTSADGLQDVPLSPNVRVYHYTGLQHFSGPWPPARGKGSLQGQQPQSPLPARFFWRAMIGNMDAWIRGTAAPPPSRYPRLADGTLVAPAAYRFPALPGVTVPRQPSQAWRLDFGPEAKAGFHTLQPPKVGPPFPVLVPQVDADGNELGGVRLPEFAAPLATYAPWNLRAPALGAPDLRVSFEGSWLPFPKDAAARLKAGDPRRSVEERYQGPEDYLARYAKALDQLIRERYLLPEDREALMRRGREEWDFVLTGR